jgi:hypothetical protein
MPKRHHIPVDFLVSAHIRVGSLLAAIVERRDSRDLVGRQREVEDIEVLG